MGVCSAELNEFIDVNPKDHTVNMKNNKWYENEEWNSKIAENFEKRLSRSKSNYNKAQYIRLQAGSLSLNYMDIKKELLNRVINEYAEEDFQVKMAMEDLTEIYIKEGSFDKALEVSDLLWLDDTQMKKLKKGGVYSNGDIKLIKLILILGKKNRYPEAYKLAKEHDIDLDFFKYNKYEFTYYAAWLCKEMGKIDEAKRYAKMALEFAIDKRPDAPKHGDLGAFEAPEVELKFLSDIVYK